ncbi:hypothetical protein GCM10011358_10880 [Sinisalibacter lacisalsi]|uniref:Uncharacterized protein n=1 Tax=Sinisalibacter lacisalsi TaxID=1526570 RepID=A0ABQ1QJT8_9RHOB|nr:hypothetical protein GCM10011358_10880 [Sinisalibacter lacisalsi]
MDHFFKSDGSERAVTAEPTFGPPWHVFHTGPPDLLELGPLPEAVAAPSRYSGCFPRAGNGGFRGGAS